MAVYWASMSGVGAEVGWRMRGSWNSAGRMDVRIQEVAVLDWDWVSDLLAARREGQMG
jgi:hypothetical protein